MNLGKNKLLIYILCGAAFGVAIYFFYKRKLKRLNESVPQEEETQPVLQQPYEPQVRVAAPGIVAKHVLLSSPSAPLDTHDPRKRVLDPHIFEKPSDSANAANVHETESAENSGSQQYVDDTPAENEDNFHEERPLADSVMTAVKSEELERQVSKVEEIPEPQPLEIEEARPVEPRKRRSRQTKPTGEGRMLSI